MPETPSSPAPRAVFLSYAHDDSAAARRLADALRDAGLEVWFDESALHGGDAWDAKIKRQIRECALFVPVISQNTQRRREGYFRLEWHLAEERSRLIARGTPFLVPVCVDDTAEREALVPEVFLSVQWTRPRDAAATNAFAARVRQLLADEPIGETTRPRLTKARESAAGALPPPATRSRPAAIAMFVAVTGIAVAGYLFLHSSKKENSESRVPAVQAASLPEDKSIAVLPFVNLSPDKENEFFADGIHADLLTQLQGLRALRVISAQSVASYRGTTKRIPEIARELGVAYILTGTVRRAGHTVRISPQLISARTDTPLWSPPPYDRELRDIIRIQSEIAQVIATELKAALSPEERSRIDRRPTENLQAYDLYLKSQNPVRRAGATLTWLREREQLLQSAVRLDPKFTLAWVALANVHVLNYSWNYEHTLERLNKAKLALDTAERLEPEGIEVLSETGFFYANGLFEFPRAKACYERVLSRVPNYAHVWARLGYVARAEGRWLDSLANLQKAHELDRRSADYLRELAGYLERVRRFDEAEAAGRLLSELLPEVTEEDFRSRKIAFFARGSTTEVDEWIEQLPPGRKADSAVAAMITTWLSQKGDLTAVQKRGDNLLLRAMILAHQGERASARGLLTARQKALEQELTVEPENRVVWMNLALIQAISGDRDQAVASAQRSVALLPESRHAWWGGAAAAERAKVLAWAENKEEAIREIERLLRKPAGLNVHELRKSIDWLPLQGDPRFEALLNDPKNNAPLF